PHLRAIREVVRGEKQLVILRQKLDALLDAIVRTPEASQSARFAPIGLAVLRFVESLHPDKENLAKLKVLGKQVEGGSCSSEAELFAAAAPLLRPSSEPPGEGLLGKLLGRGSRGQMPEPRLLRQHLSTLLDALRVPVALDSRRTQLIDRVRDENNDILELIDNAAAIISELGVESEREHSQLREFLATLSGKLVDLEEKTLGMGSLAESSARSRIETDLAVSSHVEGLRVEAQAATELSQLQTVIASRMDVIASHLAVSKEAEEARMAETQQHVQDLAVRLQALEQESLELRNQLTTATDLAFTDPLTRLPNRAAYQDRVALEELRWKRFKHPVCLLLWDIDFFKSINDRFGHPAGDKALQVIGEVLGGSIRATDFLARIGGEEFAMLLAGSDQNAALDVANNIRRKVEACGFTSAGKPITITVSCGIAEFRPGDSHDRVYARADQALYQAKGAGRNRCIAAS
ncbi:MAG: diguanylate cyclase, partial [Methylococcaceae bacterium]|nr:diguanylate cyclase [Methylococcaceae bacterium]